MPLDDFSDLDEENLTTVTADLLSQAISTVDNTTNVSYYLGNTDCKAKCECLSRGCHSLMPIAQKKHWLVYKRNQLN